MCHGIIHTAAVASGGVATGLAQIPASDTLVITPIQITMIIGISQVFDIRIGESTAKSLLGGFAASQGGRFLSQLLVGWIPGIGNVVNASTAFALTEAIGWAAAEHFFELYCEEQDKYSRAFKAAGEKFEKKIIELDKRYEVLKEKSIKLNKEKDGQIDEDSKIVNALKEEILEIAKEKEKLMREIERSGKASEEIRSIWDNKIEVLEEIIDKPSKK